MGIPGGREGELQPVDGVQSGGNLQAFITRPMYAPTEMRAFPLSARLTIACVTSTSKAVSELAHRGASADYLPLYGRA
jgi:hypothetical protein